MVTVKTYRVATQPIFYLCFPPTTNFKNRSFPVIVSSRLKWTLSIKNGIMRDSMLLISKLKRYVKSPEWEQAKQTVKERCKLEQGQPCFHDRNLPAPSLNWGCAITNSNSVGRRKPCKERRQEETQLLEKDGCLGKSMNMYQANNEYVLGKYEYEYHCCDCTITYTDAKVENRFRC